MNELDGRPTGRYWRDDCGSPRRTEEERRSVLSIVAWWCPRSSSQSTTTNPFINPITDMIHIQTFWHQWLIQFFETAVWETSKCPRIISIL